MTPDYKEKLISFYQAHRRMPTYTEMMKLFDFKSKNAVYRVVMKMIAAGIVTKDKLGKLIPSAGFDEVPMLGFVKAGLPAPGEILNDTLNLEEYLMPKKSKPTFLKWMGNP